MKSREFDYEFDISWNNIMSNQAPGLSQYEKSVFLTQAQDIVVKGIYNGTLVTPFESTEEARSYLSPLVQQGYPSKISDQTKYPHIVSNSILYKLNDIRDINGNEIENPWFITYEGVIFSQSSRCNSEEGIVKPVTQDAFWEIHNNPFKKNNDKRVLRLTFQYGNSNLSELITEYPLDKYFIRYIRKPKPIILTKLEDGLTIDGYDRPIEYNPNDDNVECCELNDSLHRVILDMAVKLAKQAWVLTQQKQND